MKKLQSGRSMVEMLGVLAIIGVLSIGGIAGYTMSMRRHRINQILDTVNKYALIAYSSCQQAIVRGDLKDITQCHTMATVPYPTFEDAGFTKSGEVADVKFYRITSESGVDIVKMGIAYYDQILCKTTNAVLGTNVSCSVFNNLYSIGFDIKMN